MTISEAWDKLSEVVAVLDDLDTAIDAYGVADLETYMDDASEFFDAIADAGGKAMEAMDMLHSAQGRKRWVEERDAKRQVYVPEDFE